MRRSTAAVAAAGTLLATGLLTPPLTAPASGAPAPPSKTPRSVGYGGAVSSVDPDATRIGIQVLRRGGNAVDAAVATAAALGVTEPYSAGIGGGGFFVYYDAASKRVHTLDGRETAPAGITRDAFVDPATGEPYNFFPELVTSGVSVGVPGTPATWQAALRRWGTQGLRRVLKPAQRLAARGFVVDETFRRQTLDNEVRFDAFTSTRDLFLPGGDAPAVGTVFRNQDLARTYRLLRRHGTRAFYQGRLARQIARTVQDPPKTGDTALPVPPGSMTPGDLARYRVIPRRPTHVDYRGLDVYGMAPPSSGGSTVGEALNILEQYDVRSMDDAAALHHYLSATALAFADRNAYVGDPAFVDVPLRELLSDRFAAERACQIDEDAAFTEEVAPGIPDGEYEGCAAGAARAVEDDENLSTTNLTVADRWGNVVEYTLTIEQTGGSGIVVPGRGFLLNNELTDFSTVWVESDPNRIEPLKRPRSSMAPTIVLHDGRPVLALGSPGGSTIITTVAQILFNRIDRGMPILQALAAPRATQRNTVTVRVEPGSLEEYQRLLQPFGYDVQLFTDPLGNPSEIGAATAVELGRGGLMTAVAEPERRGGGSALVVHPRQRHYR